MKKQIYISATMALSLVLTSIKADAQSKIKDGTISGTSSLPRAGAVLELESSNKGAMMPRVSLSATTTWGLLGTDSAGMVVYNNNPAMTGTNAAPILSGAIGFYYWDGDRWVGMSAGSGNGDFWRLKGNTGTTPPTTVGTAIGAANYWGTTDAQNLAVGTNSTTRAIFDQNGSLYGGSGTFDATLAPLQSLVWGHNNKDSASYTLVAGQSNNLAPLAAFGVVGGSSNTLSYGGNSAAFGYNNKVNSGGSLITGNTNTIGGANDGAQYSLVSGLNNLLYGSSFSAATSSAVFGASNKDSASYTLVAGQNNTIGGGQSQMVVGENNIISKTGGSWMGVMGRNNTIGGSAGAASNDIVVGGVLNTLYNAQASAVFGQSNSDTSVYSLVAGQSNTLGIGGAYAVVGGQDNHIYSTGAGQQAMFGISNKMLGTGNGASIIAGRGNTMTSTNSTAMFGEFNIAYGTGTGLADALIAGTGNKDSASYTLVAGQNNTIASPAVYSAVLGSDNVISGANPVNFNYIMGRANTINNDGTSTTGYYSANLVTGQQNFASTANGVVFGNDNKSIGGASMVVGGSINVGYKSSGAAIFGTNNKDSAGYTLVSGQLNVIKAGADNAVALGVSNTVGHVNSMALGANAATTNNNQLVLGFANGTISTGSVATAVSSLTGSTTLDATQYTIFASGSITLTLPSGSTAKGRIYVIKNVGSSTVTIAGSSIDGGASVNVVPTGAKTVQSDGTNWWTIAQY